MHLLGEGTWGARALELFWVKGMRRSESTDEKHVYTERGLGDQ